MVIKAEHVKQGGLYGQGEPCRSQSRHSSVEAGQFPWSEGRQEGGYVKYRNSETQPDAVPEKAKQEGEIRGRWSWVEPGVWTERMLTALEQGVKGNKWFSLTLD